MGSDCCPLQENLRRKLYPADGRTFEQLKRLSCLRNTTGPRNPPPPVWPNSPSLSRALVFPSCRPSAARILKLKKRPVSASTALKQPPHSAWGRKRKGLVLPSR